jgi:cellulose synthase/poly-beta-1,6-N-acetylglucosamine synthase-like glycosyltransferase
MTDQEFVFPGEWRMPTVSVLVAAWNEEARVGACLESLVELDWPDLEVLISAGGDDGTYEAARKYASDRIVVHRQQPGQGKQAALRELFALARGNVIYLTDGDTVVPDEVFRAVVDPIIRQDADAVTGTYRPYQSDIGSPFVLYQWSIDRAVERRRGSESEGITGANVAVSRTALVACGGFDSDVKTGTDYVLARQLRAARYPIRYVDAAVETEYACRPRLYARRRSRWLRNTLLHGRRYGDRAEVRNSLVTMGIGLLVACGPLSFPLTKRWGGIAWSGLIALLLKRRIGYVHALADELHTPVPPKYYVALPILTLIDQAASVMAVADLVSRKRRLRW